MTVKYYNSDPTQLFHPAELLNLEKFPIQQNYFILRDYQIHRNLPSHRIIPYYRIHRCYRLESVLVLGTERPWDTRILVPEKNRAAQNRALWGLYICTKWDFFTKNRVSSRLLFKIRASWGYTYVLKGIFIDFFLAYLAIGTFFNWDLWTIETFKQLGIGMFGQLGPLDNWR